MATLTTTTSETKRRRLSPGGYIVEKNGKRHLRPRAPSAAEQAKAALRRKRKVAEHKRNDAIFVADHLPALLKTHRGQCAVMKSGKISGIYPSPWAAYAAAKRRYPSLVFSTHVIENPVTAYHIGGSSFDIDFSQIRVIR